MFKLSAKKWSRRSSIKLIKIPKGEIVIKVFGHPIGPLKKSTVFRWTFVMVTPRNIIIRNVTGVKNDPRLKGIICAPTLMATMRGIIAARKEGYSKITVVSKTVYPGFCLDSKLTKTNEMSIMMSWVIRSYRRWIASNTSDINLTYAVRTK